MERDQERKREHANMTHPNFNSHTTPSTPLPLHPFQTRTLSKPQKTSPIAGLVGLAVIVLLVLVACCITKCKCGREKDGKGGGAGSEMLLAVEAGVEDARESDGYDGRRGGDGGNGGCRVM